MIEIGDYIEYEKEYYNSVTYNYEKCNYSGCVFQINDDKNNVNIIKQYGGELWYFVKPIRKISEEEFLLKFSIYDEYNNSLLEKIDILPPKMQIIIRNIIENKKLRFIYNMIIYCIYNKSKKSNLIKIDDEVLGLEYYVYKVLRQYEPYKIKNTINYCYGATDLMKEFMKTNVNFMIDMQFICEELEHIILYLIQEKWLEFLYNKKIIGSKEYSSRLFPIIIKKLEIKLEMKLPIEDKNVTFYVDKDERNYKIETTLLDLIDSKFVLSNNYGKYVSNKNSTCHKRINVNLKNSNEWKLVKEIGNKMIRVDKPDFIKNSETSYSYYLNSQKNIIICKSTFTIGICSAEKFTMYLMETKKIIGSFEFNIDDNDFGFISLNDIEIH
jgi:hypothetical protein